MRKTNIILSLITLLVMPMCIRSQAVVAPTYDRTSHTFMNGDVEKTLIQRFRHESITYYETTMEHGFILYDSISNTATRVVINNAYSVNDFVIVTDVVYFCGEANSMGFIGHFYISDFFYTAMHNYTVSTSPFICSTGNVVSFDRMVAYGPVGGQSLAAIGHDAAGNSLVAELLYDPLAVACNYRIGELNPLYTESFLDITVTDNYVVTAGFLNSSLAAMLSFRIYDKSDIFATGGPQDVQYMFAPNSTTVSTFDTSQLVMSHVQVDHFAVAAYWQGANSTHNEGTYLGVYRIDFSAGSYSISNSLTPLLLSSYIIQPHTNGNWRLRGFTEEDFLDYFYLLQNADVAGMGRSSIVYELSYPMFLMLPSAVSSTSMRVRNDAEMQAIDVDNSRYGFVSNGYSLLVPNRLDFENGTHGWNKCTSIDAIDRYALSMTDANPTRPLSVTNWDIATFQTFPSNSATMQINVECVEP